MTQEEKLKTLQEQVYNLHNKYFNEVNRMFDNFAWQYETETESPVNCNEEFLQLYKLVFFSSALESIRSITRQLSDKAKTKAFNAILEDLKAYNRKMENKK